MRRSPMAQPLSPAELASVRRLLASGTVVDDYEDAAVVARKLGLGKRTVLDLARDGEFDGEWGNAFKPAPNRLRIPLRGVDAYIRRNPAAFFVEGAGIGTEGR